MTTNTISMIGGLLNYRKFSALLNYKKAGKKFNILKIEALSNNKKLLSDMSLNLSNIIDLREDKTISLVKTEARKIEITLISKTSGSIPVNIY